MLMKVVVAESGGGNGGSGTRWGIVAVVLFLLRISSFF